MTAPDDETFQRVLVILVTIIAAAITAAIRLYAWSRRRPGSNPIAALLQRDKSPQADHELYRRADLLRWLLLFTVGWLAVTIVMSALI
jgi:hypothetical protein